MKPLDAKDMMRQCGWAGINMNAGQSCVPTGQAPLFNCMKTLSLMFVLEFSLLLLRQTVSTLRSGDFNPSLIILIHK